MRKTLLLGLVIALAATGLTLAQEARVRVVHASPNTPGVDVYVNDSILAFENAEFPAVTGYAPLPAGVYNFKAVVSGSNPTPDAPINVDANLFYNTDYTVVAVDFLENITPLLLVDDNRPVSVNKSRVRFVHASPNAGPVDIRVMDGPYLFQNVDFKDNGGYVTVPAGTYDLEVLVAGTETVALPLPGVAVDGGTTYTVYAVGVLGGTPALGVQVSVDNENRALGSNGRRFRDADDRRGFGRR